MNEANFLAIDHRPSTIVHPEANDSTRSSRHHIATTR
jgi:hypothetical protein